MEMFKKKKKNWIKWINIKIIDKKNIIRKQPMKLKILNQLLKS